MIQWILSFFRRKPTSAFDSVVNAIRKHDDPPTDMLISPHDYGQIIENLGEQPAVFTQSERGNPAVRIDGVALRPSTAVVDGKPIPEWRR